MSHPLNLAKFQTDEGSYNRIQEIYPPAPEESKAVLKTSPLPSQEIYSVKKDGFGQELVLRNNLRAEGSADRSVSSKEAQSPSSFRSTSGLFNASRGESLKNLLDRKRAN